MNRVVCQFSCGAASAVATKLTIAKYGHERIVILNAFIVEEEADNRRFLADCETWLEHPITVLRDTKYGASTDEVWRRKRYLKGQHGAPCSMHLKRQVLAEAAEPDDIDVIGYTGEEEDRLDDLRLLYPARTIEAPLIDKGLGKAACLAMVERAGIELPLMYRLGFHNANCVGCVKGGEGYFNKIRAVFPARFERLAQIQEEIGPGSYLFRNRKTGERYSLRDLPPDKGRYQDEPEISCDFLCNIAEQDIADAALVAAREGCK